jgi:hypothetical protein
MRQDFTVKQDMLFVAVPLGFNLLFLLASLLFTGGVFRLILSLLALGFAGFVLWQSRFMFSNYRLSLTQKGVEVANIFGKTVRRVDWRKVEGVAAGYKRTWKLYAYSFYFRVKKEEDVPFSLISREENLANKLSGYIKVFVRRRIPVKLVKG